MTQSTVTLKVRRLHSDAIIPQYQTAGAACFDLHAIGDVVVYGQSSGVIGCGLSFEVPSGFALMIYSRSGHGFHHGIRLANAVAVIDSDYRGEVMLKLRNDYPSVYSFKMQKGDRIAQAMLVPIPRVELVDVIELSETVRGEKGFGSTDGE